MAQKFYTRLTQIGQAKYANAVGVGEQVEFVQLVVGDGGGQELTPEQVQQRETMVNQVRVGPINQVYKDADNPNWLVMEQVLPPDVGGWTIREVGVIDADGDLVAYGNYPATYKPVLEEGSSRTSTVRFVLMVSDTSVVTLKVDPSVVLATRKYVDDEIDKHEQSRNHPAATTTAPGFVEKATVTEAKNGAADKYPDAAGVLAALHQFGWTASPIPVAGGSYNDYRKPGVYAFSSGASPANNPAGSASRLIVLGHESWPVQICTSAYTSEMWIRTLDESGGDFNEWFKFTHSGNQLVLGKTATDARVALGLGSAAIEAASSLLYRSQNLSDLVDKAAAFDTIKQLATTTLAGVVEKATVTEAKAGAANKFPDSAGMMAAIDDGMAYQNVVVFEVAGTTAWAVPQVLQDGRRKASVTVIGAGGGAGRHKNTGGGGGGGGGIAYKLVDLTGVPSVDITVGGGGAGASAGSVNDDGEGGGTSSFGAYCSATGGGGANNWLAGVGGAGIGGDINTSYGPGSNASYDRESNQKPLQPGNGGGPGGRGSGTGSPTAPGSDATLPGGGGGGGTGAGTTGQNSGAGGNGAPGMVIVRF